MSGPWAAGPRSWRTGPAWRRRRTGPGSSGQQGPSYGPRGPRPLMTALGSPLDPLPPRTVCSKPNMLLVHG